MTANTPRSRKAKGKEFQNFLRQDIIDTIGVHEKDILSTPMGLNGCDIYLSQAARGLFPFGIEAKRTERLDLWGAWEQACTNATREELHPLLVVKRNKTEPLAILRWFDFICLMERLNEYRRKGSVTE